MRSAPEIDLEWTMTTDSMLRDFYIVHKDVPLDRLVLQSSEVCAAKWVTYDRLCDMADNGQTRAPWQGGLRYAATISADVSTRYAAAPGPARREWRDRSAGRVNFEEKS